MTELISQIIENNGLNKISLEQAEQFSRYLDLLLKWNAKTNLTAIRDADGIVQRHFLESIATAQALPESVKTLLDFGSGAGFPGLPIAICKPELAVTLAESQGKKASFLREAIRTIPVTNTKVHAARAEELNETFDCVAMRAVDNMHLAILAASQLVSPSGHLAILTTPIEAAAIQGNLLKTWVWQSPIPLPSSDHRALYLATRG